MTKYNLEEFKRWLEEKPERKENLPYWSHMMNNCYFNGLVAFLDIPVNRQLYNDASHQPYQQVIKKWINEVDNRERERERERESKMRRQQLIW